MPTLFFPERDTLRLVLASGGMAAPAMRSPAEVGWDEQGRLWLTTNAMLPREAMIALQRFGVRIVGSSAAAATEQIACWQQLVPLEKTPVAAEMVTDVVLFDLPGGEFSSLVGEIERSRGSAWSYRWLDDIANENGRDRVLVKSESPPYFTLLRAADSASTFAYIEQSPRIWTAVGWRHPFANQIEPPAGKMLFLRQPRMWEWRDNRPFQTTTETVGRIVNPSAKQDRLTIVPTGLKSIAIPMRLVTADDPVPAEMWIIRDEPFQWLEGFLRAIDERMLQRFTCAIAHTDGKPVLVLRTRGKGPLPILVEAACAYRPLLKLANLFAPCGHTLTPLPRRDTIRQLLSPDANRLTWLRLLEGGAFATESVALETFRPLTEYVTYKSEAASHALRPWPGTSGWQFERFQIKAASPPLPKRAPAVQTLPPPPRAEESREETPKKAGWLSRVVGMLRKPKRGEQPPPLPAEDELQPIPMEEAVRTALPSPVRTLEQTLKVNEAKDRVKSLASRFHDALEDLTPAKSLELWPELAAAFAQSNQPGDAALCWLNGLWEQDSPSVLWAWGWLKAESAQAGWNPQQIDLNHWLAAPADRFRARALAAYTLWAALQPTQPDGFATNLTRINAYLDANENELPIRAAWLARVALARCMRGDVLALAHTRDRLMARLGDNGLSLALDVPSFVRSAGSDDPERLGQVNKWLTTKRKTIHDWIAGLAPDRGPNSADARMPSLYEYEAEIPFTQAYADLMIAWGLSRLGENNEAGRLRDQAHRLLPEADPIHHFLRAEFDQRLQEARENRASGPLSSRLQALLDALSPNDRYRVDRLRQRSRILEPVERIDVWWASTMQHYRGWDALARQLVEFPGLERGELNHRAKAMLERSDRDGASASVSPAILQAVLGMASRIDGALIEIALDRALALQPTAGPAYLRVLERGLLAAAALGFEGKVRLFAHRFASYVEEQKGQSSPVLLEGLTGHTFRCLRKFGMKDEADNVLSKIALWLTRGLDLKDLRRSRANDWPILLRTLLHVAAGWYYCGRGTRGHRIIEEARSRDLFDASGERTGPERTGLALAYASAIGQMPSKIALGCFEELFLRLKRISVAGWNTHYTLQPLELIDTVIRSVASDDFSLGPDVRGWLDDDEFNVRQRIHREMKQLLEQQGLRS